MDSEDKDLVRQNIIEAASIVFEKFGYKKATMDEIGMAANKGKTAIYYYFKNKEDIFSAVINKEANILNSTISSAINKEKSPIEKLKAYFNARMYPLLKVSNLYDAMKNELFDQLEFINQTRKEHDKFERSLVISILEEGVEVGEFKIENIELTATTLVNILKEMKTPFFLTNDFNDLDNKLNNLLNIICFGLVKR